MSKLRHCQSFCTSRSLTGWSLWCKIAHLYVLEVDINTAYLRTQNLLNKCSIFNINSFRKLSEIFRH